MAMSTVATSSTTSATTSGTQAGKMVAFNALGRRAPPWIRDRTFVCAQTHTTPGRGYLLSNSEHKPLERCAGCSRGCRRLENVRFLQFARPRLDFLHVSICVALLTGCKDLADPPPRFVKLSSRLSSPAIYCNLHPRRFGGSVSNYLIDRMVQAEASGLLLLAISSPHPLLARDTHIASNLQHAHAIQESKGNTGTDCFVRGPISVCARICCDGRPEARGVYISASQFATVTFCFPQVQHSMATGADELALFLPVDPDAVIDEALAAAAAAAAAGSGSGRGHGGGGAVAGTAASMSLSSPAVAAHLDDPALSGLPPSFRDEFLFPKTPATATVRPPGSDCIYLCGNSLGLQVRVCMRCVWAWVHVCVCVCVCVRARASLCARVCV
jgi:hypothetical protein